MRNPKHFKLWEVPTVERQARDHHNGSHFPSVCTRMVPTTGFIYAICTYMHGVFFPGHIFSYHTCILWAQYGMFSLSQQHAFWILRRAPLLLTCFNKQSPLPAELPCRSCRSSACSNATSTGGGVRITWGFAQGVEASMWSTGQRYRVPIHGDPGNSDPWMRQWESLVNPQLLN